MTAAPAFLELVQDNRQLTVHERRVRVLDVERAIQPHRARKPAEFTLDEVEGLMSRGGRGRLFARDQEDA